MSTTAKSYRSIERDFDQAYGSDLTFIITNGVGLGIIAHHRMKYPRRTGKVTDFIFKHGAPYWYGIAITYLRAGDNNKYRKMTSRERLNYTFAIENMIACRLYTQINNHPY